MSTSIPEGFYETGNPYRLSDGSLVAGRMGGPPPRSADGGKTWTALNPSGGWRSDLLEVVVVGDRILVDDSGVMWESADDGATFHELAGAADYLASFGDLAYVAINRPVGEDVPYVGVPLPPDENPGTTPTATALPVPSVGPSATPEPTPAGGISSAEAMRIAATVAHPNAAQRKAVSAHASLDSDYGRWTWYVDYFVSCGALCGAGPHVTVDYFTGEVLGSGYGEA